MPSYVTDPNPGGPVPDFFTKPPANQSRPPSALPPVRPPTGHRGTPGSGGSIPHVTAVNLGGTIVPAAVQGNTIIVHQNPSNAFRLREYLATQIPNLGMLHVPGITDVTKQQLATNLSLTPQLQNAFFSKPLMVHIQEKIQLINDLHGLQEEIRSINSKPSLSPRERDKAQLLSLTLNSPLPPAPMELFNEIGTIAFGAVGHIETISNIASNVVDSIPYLGTITAGFKALFTGISIGLLVKEVSEINQIRYSSFSALEYETTLAITQYQKREGGLLATELTMNVGKALTSVIGGSIFVGIASSIVDILAKVIEEIYYHIKTYNFNQALQVTSTGGIPQAQINIELLEYLPLFGLHLPHLPAVDTLTLLGCLPYRWRVVISEGELITKLREIRDPELALTEDEITWLTTPMAWPKVQGDLNRYDGILQKIKNFITGQEISSPYQWKEDIRRAIMLLEKTDKYLNTTDWRLYKASRELMHDPSPTGMIDKLKAKIFSG